MATKNATRNRATEPTPTAAKRPLVPDYGTDFYGWALQQANLLQEGRLSEIDTINVAEELIDLGNEQYDKLESALAVLFMHLLKWDYQPEKRARSWENTVREQRRRVERLLRKNPSLRPRTDEAVAESYQDGRDRASSETDIAVDRFPPECPYGWDEIMMRPIRYDPPVRSR